MGGGGTLGALRVLSGTTSIIFSANGLLNFSFQSDVPSGPYVANGSNPYPVVGTEPNFFVSFFDGSGNLWRVSSPVYCLTTLE